jgi:hypothetical protein
MGQIRNSPFHFHLLWKKKVTLKSRPNFEFIYIMIAGASTSYYNKNIKSSREGFVAPERFQNFATLQQLYNYTIDKQKDDEPGNW